MAGYIGSKASVVSSGAERKKVFNITTSTTVLTGLSYTANQVHVFHNGVRLVDATDFTATNGNSITLTNAAENGDQVVVVSYASFQTSDTVSASAGGTFSADVTVSGDLNTTDVLPSTDNTSDLGSTAKRYQDLYLSGGLYVGGTDAANKLDDYEEGTWTPTFTQLTSAPSSTTYASGTYGRYTKVGRLVHASCRIELSAVSGGSGQVVIDGLPYAAVSAGDAFTASLGVVFGSWSSTAAPRTGFMSNGQTYIKLYTHDSADARDGIDTPVNALAIAGLIMNITYSTS